MKNIILFILVLVASSCSTVVEETPSKPEPPKPEPPSYVDEMDKKYPHWNLKLFDFYVGDTDAGPYGDGDSPTAEDNKNARIITIREKEIILEKINRVRFVINTPEFANLLRTKLFYSSRNDGSVKLGDPMDSERILKVVRRGSFYTQFRKMQVSSGALATATVGTFLYIADDEELTNVSHQGLRVNIPNKWSWERYADDEYMVEAIFHELLHNMGFNHKLAGTGLRDATYGMQQDIFHVIYNDPKWRAKYKNQLESYLYYNKKYEHFLQADSVPDLGKQFNGTDLFTADQTKVGNTHNNEIEEVCILYPDGTYKLVKMRNGRMI